MYGHNAVYSGCEIDLHPSSGRQVRPGNRNIHHSELTMTTHTPELHPVTTATFLEGVTPINRGNHVGVKLRQDAIVFMLMELKGVIEHEFMTPIEVERFTGSRELKTRVCGRYAELKEYIELRLKQVRLALDDLTQDPVFIKHTSEHKKTSPLPWVCSELKELERLLEITRYHVRTWTERGLS